MSSLYVRATPEQARLLRIVSGAVRNALHAHPEVVAPNPDRFARSIAKRAVGTLASQGVTLAGGREPLRQARVDDLLNPSRKQAV